MEIVGNISVNDYQKLHIAVGWKMIDDKQIEIALKHSMFISCAKQENQVIGMARIVGDFGRHGVLTDMIVLPQFQKMGVGRKLIEDLMRQVQDFVNKGMSFWLSLLQRQKILDFIKNVASKMSQAKCMACINGSKIKIFTKKDAKSIS